MVTEGIQGKPMPGPVLAAKCGAGTPLHSYRHGAFLLGFSSGPSWNQKQSVLQNIYLDDRQLKFRWFVMYKYCKYIQLMTFKRLLICFFFLFPCRFVYSYAFIFPWTDAGRVPIVRMDPIPGGTGALILCIIYIYVCLLKCHANTSMLLWCSWVTAAQILAHSVPQRRRSSTHLAPPYLIRHCIHKEIPHNLSATVADPPFAWLVHNSRCCCCWSPCFFWRFASSLERVMSAIAALVLSESSNLFDTRYKRLPRSWCCLCIVACLLTCLLTCLFGASSRLPMLHLFSHFCFRFGSVLVCFFAFYDRVNGLLRLLLSFRSSFYNISMFDEHECQRLIIRSSTFGLLDFASIIGYYVVLVYCS